MKTSKLPYRVNSPRKLTLVLPLLVLLTLGVTTWPRGQSNSGRIEIQVAGDETQSEAAITLHGIGQADYVLVDIFYWQTVKDIPTPLLLHKMSVLPFYADIALGSDPVPVPRSAVKSVNVTVVKTVETHSEQFNQGDAK